MPQQQGIMSAYQLMPHNHSGMAQGGQISYVDALLEKPIVDARDYGLDPANTAAQNGVILATLIALDENFYIKAGDYSYDTEFIVPDGRVIKGECRDTRLIYTGAGTYGVRLGSYCGLENLQVIQAVDRTPARAGIQIIGAHNKLIFDRIEGFRYGVEFLGDATNCYYNDLYSISFADNFYDYYLTALNGGHVNENKFYGGKVSGCGDANSYGVYIAHNPGGLLNGNKFYGVTIECLTHGVYCDSVFNAWYSTRNENVGNDFVFGANSHHNMVFTEETPVIVDNSVDEEQMIIAHDITELQALRRQFHGIPLPVGIIGGVLTQTESYHAVNTEDGVPLDNLDTISAPHTDGMILILRAYDDTHTVRLTDDVGNIKLEGNVNMDLDTLADKIVLIWDAGIAKWCELSRFNG